ncbi:MAG: hypothetical protein KAR09_05120 [Bacteroidales bacterium]|nr:hypothetical protein [Bacteroidales bacterium]
MEERLAKVISVIFHPLLIPTYLIAVLINLNVFFALMIPDEAKWKIIILVLITSAIFPLIILYGMYRLKLVKSLLIDSREERLYPYIATSIFFFVSCYMIWQINISPVYYYCLLGASILAVLTLLINIFWKISAHTVSMGGVLGILIGLQTVLLIDIMWLIVIIILISGIVGFARLRAGTHTQAQIYTGYILGFFGTFLLILYY